MRLRLPAAEIIVELAVENIRVDRLHDLGKTTTTAAQNLEWKPFLLLILAVQKAVRDRHLAEIDDRPQIGRMAEAAMIRHGWTRFRSWFGESTGPTASGG